MNIKENKRQAGVCSLRRFIGKLRKIIKIERSLTKEYYLN